MSQRRYNTNLASEFYVLSTLYRLGLDANLTLGNKKSVDITVVRGAGRAITVDVKAVAGKNDWLVGQPPARERKGHFIVLICYEGRFEDLTIVPRAWVLPHQVFLKLVKTAKTNTAHYISRKRVTDECREFENRWDLLRERVS